MLKCFILKFEDEKAFAAERKIREFKKILLKSKQFVKSNGQRIKPNELIKKAAENMNETNSTKYGVSPESIEEKTLDSTD